MTEKTDTTDKSADRLPRRVHIIGICGVATSTLAIAFHKVGVKVTGSDKGFFPPVSTELEKHDVPFYAGWHPEKMVENGIPDLIIAGASGTSLSNPEIIYAKQHHIPLLSFAEALGKFVIRKNSVVIAGTWGKTSSSALLSFILIEAGMNPSYFTGGVSLSHPTAAVTNADWSVVEGDEYKVAIWDKRPKFACYSPTHLLLTAVSWDHADLYQTETDYFVAFDRLVTGIPSSGVIVANKDQAGVDKVIKNASAKKVTYGIKNADYWYDMVKQSETGLDFTIHHAINSWEIHSPMLGAYQAENITGCFAMAHSIGTDPEKIIIAISRFRGLKRRLEKRLDGTQTPRGITVMDDIAHSPEKATAVLKTLREIYKGKIIAVFEPNIGGRSRESAYKYDRAFENSDIVIIPHLTKLKVSDNKSGLPMEGDELAGVIKKTHSNTRFMENDAKLVLFLISQTKPGDVIVFLGSHGFRGMIEEVIRNVKK